MIKIPTKPKSQRNTGNPDLAKLLAVIAVALFALMAVAAMLKG